MSAVEFMLAAAVVIGIVLAYVLTSTVSIASVLVALLVGALLMIVYVLAGRVRDRGDS